MWGRLFWDWALAPNYASIVAMLLLALALAVYGFQHRPTRLFIIFLVLRSFASLSATMRGAHINLTQDLADASYWAAVFPYFIIPVPFVLLAFAAIYPHRRRFGRRNLARNGVWIGTGALTVIIVVALELLYATDHAYWTGGNESDALAGSFRALVGATSLAYGILGLVFSRDAIRHQGTDLGTSLLLVATGFTVNAMYDGIGILWFLIADAIPPNVSDLLTASAALPATAATITLTHYAYRARRDAFAGLAVRAIGIIGASIILFQPPLLTSAFAPAAPNALFLPAITNGIVRLAIPTFVTYALLRHQMFDIDLKIKWTLTQGSVAAVIYAVFFIISEGIEQGLNIDGLWFGIGAAALVTIAVRPLQRGAQRVAEALLPGVRADQRYVDAQKLDLYETAYESILWDGTLTAKESRSLVTLRTKLGLSSDDCSVREAQVRARLGLSSAVEA